MVEKVRKYMEQHHMIDRGDKIVLGVSGGADSVALLLLLDALKVEFDLQLFVVHINHKIRGDAEEDAHYVESLCKQCEIPFYLFEENVLVLAAEEKKSEEEMGRICRYRRFYQVVEQVNANKLALAHHMDDQAETVLFHLVRGTNLSGMRGMLPVKEFVRIGGQSSAACQIIRPLLQCRKEEVVKWLKEKQVDWKEDSTNGDNHYARNRLRNQVVPELTRINDQAVRHIAGFAENAAQYEQFFRSAVVAYLKENLEALEGEETGCQIKRHGLKEESEILAKAVIYEMLGMVSGVRKDVADSHVQAVYDLLDKQSGKKVVLPYQMEAEISYEKLIIRKCFDKENIFKPWELEIDWRGMLPGKKEVVKLPSGKTLVLQVENLEERTEPEREEIFNSMKNSKNNYTKFFDCDTIKDTLYVRTPEAEDYLVINNNGNTKKLSRYFIDEKIPADKRKEKLVVASRHEVLWIVGGRRCENHRINDNTKNILLLMCEGENDEISYRGNDFRGKGGDQNL